MLGLGVLIALLGAGAAAAVLRSPRAPAPRVWFTETSAPFTITYRRPWQPVTSPVPGSDALSARSGHAHGGPLRLAFGYATLAAGRLARSSSIPGGVPPALAHRYGRYRTGDAVVAGQVGRKYTWSMPGGSLVAYVIAFGDGDAAAICSAPREAPGALRACGLLARNAHVSGVGVISPGHDAVLARTIGTALDPVVAARSSLHGLRGAPLAARAPRAARFANLESHAGTALAGLRPTARYAPEVARLAAALKDEAARFDALAHAARAKHRAAYAREARRVSIASGRVKAASQALAGYRLGVPTVPVLHLAPPPAIVVRHGPRSERHHRHTPHRVFDSDLGDNYAVAGEHGYFAAVLAYSDRDTNHASAAHNLAPRELQASLHEAAMTLGGHLAFSSISARRHQLKRS